MPTQKFAFKRGGEKKLEITGSKVRQVSLDGKHLGAITREELKNGWSYKTAKGVLTIKKGSGLASTLLDVRWNGKALPGSSGDPQMKLNVVVLVIFFIALINIGIGVFILVAKTDFFGVADPEDGPSFVINGLIYGVLGVFSWRGSAFALGLTIIGNSVDIFALLLGAFEPTSGIALGGIAGGMVTRATFLYYMFQGFAPINELKREAANTRPDVDVAPFQSTDKRIKSFFEPEAKSDKPAVAPRKANKLSMIEMILIGIVIILVVVIGDLLLLGASLNNNPPPVNQVAALPTIVITPTPLSTNTPTLRPATQTPPPTPTATPYPFGTVLEIPRDIIDIAYSPALARMITAVDDHDLMTRDMLYTYDPLTRTEATIPTCQYVPTNIVLDPAGKIAVVSYQGGICVIDLIQQKIINEFEIDPNTTLKNQILTDQGWLYFQITGGTQKGIHALDINQPSPAINPVYSAPTYYFTIVDKTLYMLPLNDLFQVGVWDISDGWPTRKYEWEFSDIHYTCRHSWISSDEQYLFNFCGDIFEIAANGDIPTYIDKFMVSYDRHSTIVGYLTDAVAADRIIIIGIGSTSSSCNDTVYIYDRESFALETEYSLPDDAPCAKDIFMDRDGIHYYILIGGSYGEENTRPRIMIGDLTANHN